MEQQHMEEELPDCLRQSPPQCREIQINAKVPLDWALPLYGLLMPLVVAVTVLTNSFIVVVLSHRSLRTPTNVVLGAMAISELLTGLVCLPWLLYYYTFRGFETDEQSGLPSGWCSLFPYLATILPSIFHTAAIWLTVYLAVQRFIYICVPKLVRSQCTMHRSKQVIVCIFVASVWIYAPELFASYNQSFRLTDPMTNRTRRLCLMSRTVLIQMVGNNLYHLLLYGLHTILVHTLPCILLVIFTWRLIAAIRKADKKHSYLVGRNQQAQRKFTTAGMVLPDEQQNGAQPILGRYSLDEGAQWSCVSITEPAGSGQSQQNGEKMGGRSSISESKRVQGLKQNTRMLLAVILLFLVTEIPAALIFSVHVGTVALKFTFIINHYAVLNKLLIVRNVLIVISYPLRFAIYCGMSAQFREVVQQMLTKRHKFFFLRFPYGKLYAKEVGGRSSSDGSPLEKKTSVMLQKSSVVWRSADAGCGTGVRSLPAPLDRRATLTAITEVSSCEQSPQQQKQPAMQQIQETLQQPMMVNDQQRQQQEQTLSPPVRSCEPDEDENSECRL